MSNSNQILQYFPRQHSVYAFHSKSYSLHIPTEIWLDNTPASEGYNEINNSSNLLMTDELLSGNAVVPKRADAYTWVVLRPVERISGQHSGYAFHSKLLLGVFLQKYDLTIL